MRLVSAIVSGVFLLLLGFLIGLSISSRLPAVRSVNSPSASSTSPHIIYSTTLGTPTPITVYSGQPCLDFSAVGNTSCAVSNGKGEITANFAVTSHCSGDETIETIFAYEVSNSATGENGLASWDPIQNIDIAPEQTIYVQHKIDKVVQEYDRYHFRLVILNEQGSLKKEFTTENEPICYQGQAP